MRITIILLLAACALAGLQTWRIGGLTEKAEQAQRIIGTLSAGIESRDNAINRLNDEAVTRERQEQRLRTQLARAGEQARVREVHIQRLLNENQEIRDWYGTRLPDGISRMHARPAFASAADYLHWLSGGNQLPDTGKLTGH
ncbi:Rz-like lysis system protein LysB [Rahnella woolbedingensis]|uniref:LysB family phage lysis regulatory protein n=1 Tax=Rahnella woolbedingensis TaxID=1510574 RepID=A0A419N1U9_9GAMM|nr:Rz-like lysis system protein LysB [Rahnella woolbedingensis]RJT31501.1 LysB family phage lysis regulatory protein [Rahnella woolbedingensis]